MRNTLPDLRLTIAEGMTALAHAKADHWQPYMEAKLMRLYNGAETLRWCAAREAPTTEELQAEIADLASEHEDAEAIVSELIANVRAAVRSWSHADACPAGQLEARGDNPCHCELDKRRASILDAVA